MPAVKRAFVDSNLWVYAALELKGEPRCSLSRALLQQPYHWVISGQVLSEVSNVLLKNRLDTTQVRDQIRVIAEGSECLSVTTTTVDHALEIRQQYGFSFYDAQIVASALQANCTVLYTEDLQHLQTIEGSLAIVNPFAET